MELHSKLRCLLSFCLRFRIAVGDISRFKFSQKAAIKLGSELDLEPFVTFVSFCLRFFLMSCVTADRLDLSNESLAARTGFFRVPAGRM